MEISDLILLGRACPDMTRDGRKTVCLGGYSGQYGFIRLYPVRPDFPAHTWDILKAQVERNPQDSRAESWKLEDSRKGWDVLNSKLAVVGHFPEKQREALLNELLTDCTTTLNHGHISLGIIHPRALQGVFSDNPLFGKDKQALLMDELSFVHTKSDYENRPYIHYQCQKGCTHHQQLLEWGAHEWMRKAPQNIDQLWRNYRLDDKAYDHFLFVGNQANQRTSYVVISIMFLKKSNALQHFLFH